MTDNTKFNSLNVSSKIAICGLPIRLDTYKTCSHGCRYCFSNYRIIMSSDKDKFQVANIENLKKKLSNIFDNNKYSKTNLLDCFIRDGITWHCGGMSDPLQPVEGQYHITNQVVELTKQYNISVLFSTKGFTDYGINFDPLLHSFQFSITNINDRRDIEPNIASFKERYDFYRQLKSRGFRCGIRIQPFIPSVSSSEIVEVFKDADYFTIEGLKLVPQDREHRQYLLDLLGLTMNDFCLMGLLNIKPQKRELLYKDTVDLLNKYGIPYSIADNDMHDISSGKCCCGDPLIKKSTDFNSTAMCKKYGANYTLEQLFNELGCYKDCVCNHLFASNRVHGCRTVEDFYRRKFTKTDAIFSPRYLYCNQKLGITDLFCSNE